MPILRSTALDAAFNYAESADLPAVRSGNLAFDALFALAGAEMKQDSVREIRDGNYNGGAAIACECFETGEKYEGRAAARWGAGWSEPGDAPAGWQLGNCA